MPRAGKTVERGYGVAHRGLRAWWAPRVKRGGVLCWRCGGRIRPGQRWHLGHDDTDRRRYRGPEHERCNTLAARRLQLGQDPTPTTPQVEPPDGDPIEAARW